MKETIAPISFGILIAFFLPGFVALYSISYISVPVRTVFDTVLTKDGQIGATFIILLGSATSGVIISALREIFLVNIPEKFRTEKMELDYSNLKDPSVREAFKDAIDNTYRYTQFYGNMSMSLLMFLVLKFAVVGGCIWDNIKAQPTIFVLSAITAIILLVQHEHYLKETHGTIKQILSKPQEEGGQNDKESQEKRLATEKAEKGSAGGNQGTQRSDQEDRITGEEGGQA